jgi:two-component system response regulator HydG
MTELNPIGHILVVDDEPSMRTTLSILLKKEGYQVSQAGDGTEALKMLEHGQYDMVLTDLKMEGVDGMELLRQVKAVDPHTEVLIFTAYGTVTSAVEAMKLGAYDYIGKPFDEEELLLKVARGLERKALVREVQDLRAELKGQRGMKEIIATSKEMKEVLTKVSQVAPTEATVLIEGESGTGKELIARAIHQGSPRRDRPFIPINCSSFPETLLESELFGYEKGAFTGAEKGRKGLFEAAHQGTLFLDEIGDMPRPLQGKLLRALQEGEVRRLGSTDPIKVQVRIVAATNQQIEALVAQGILRDDLFYRLNVVRISVPPLRERRDDIIPLAQHFLKIYQKRAQKVIRGFAPEAIQAMLKHPWPGNVRELENAIEHAMILTPGKIIEPQYFPPEIRHMKSNGSPPPPPKRDLGIEEENIRRALATFGGNVSRAATNLRIHRTTLWRKMREFGITRFQE